MLPCLSTVQLAMPIELNARIGGAETFTNVLHTWGVDLARAALRIAFGLTPELPASLLPNLTQSSISTYSSAQGLFSKLPAAVPLSSLVDNCDGSAQQRSSDQSREPPFLEFPDPAPYSNEETEEASQPGISLSASLDQGRFCCGCPAMCCSDRCCYWDFVLLNNPAADVIRPLSLGGLSEPCLVSQRPTSPSCREREQKTQAAAVDGVRGGCLCATLALSQMLEEGGRTNSQMRPDIIMTHPSSILREKQKCLSKISHDQLWSQQVADNTSCFDRELKAPDQQQQLRASICDVQPKSFVHSVNLLPDWSGWGVIKRIEMLPAARALTGFVDAELYGKQGDLVALPPAGFAAVGWVVSKSLVDAESAAGFMDEILEHLVIEIGCVDGELQGHVPV